MQFPHQPCPCFFSKNRLLFIENLLNNDTIYITIILFVFNLNDYMIITAIILHFLIFFLFVPEFFIYLDYHILLFLILNF
jgi:hypothetical protein